MDDKSIRNQLFKLLKKENLDVTNTLIVNEFNVCNGLARIDIAVLNGSIHGYEIKSDFDTLHRLPNQIYFYNKSLDRITLTTTRKHLSEAKKIVPKWWGILLADNICERIEFKEIRKPKVNPQKNINAFLELLWKNELVQIIVSYNLKFNKNANREKLSGIIISNLKSNSIYKEVRYILKTRKSWRI